MFFFNKIVQVEQDELHQRGRSETFLKEKEHWKKTLFGRDVLNSFQRKSFDWRKKFALDGKHFIRKDVD